MADPLSEMLASLNLTDTGARTREDIFTGHSQPMPSGRVFGGQVMAQALVAAQRTISPERHAHSMHGYFLRPGDLELPITFSVDRIHDGRSFSTRRTQAYQDGQPILSMIASFQDDDPGLDHQVAMPSELPDPESLPSTADTLAGVDHSVARAWAMERSFDVRHVPSPIYLTVEGERTETQAVWMKTVRPMPDDRDLHQAALVYASDFTIQESVLRRHGVPWSTPGLKVASLDHAMWLHRPGRVDDWLLYVQESPTAVGGRGLAQGRVYSRDGVLLASVAQEITVRVPDF
ncbi:MAG: acyl-CoA thioesterase II [Rhodoglobus sp.]